MISSRSIVLSMTLLASLPIGAAQAGVISPDGIGAALERNAVVDHVQYRWGGREYCWYPSGWHGPGWYWCGYRLRVGLGWGGPAGWHGWAHRGGGDRVGVETRGRIDRRGSVGVEERGRIDRRGSVGVEERGRIDRRGSVGVEGRGRIGSEGRGSVGTEQRGRVGVEGRGGATTGQGGAAARGRTGVEGGATSGQGGAAAPSGSPSGGGMRES